jgi:hypothetical protein
MLPERPMSHLSASYEQLGRAWTHKQLAEQYREANRRGELGDQAQQVDRPVAMLATAVPACATLDVAIHVIHVLPATADNPGLMDQLLGNVDTSAAVALHRCHQALELDGRVHDYRADEWLPGLYDIAAPLLEDARLNREPPSLVDQAQDAISWLSRAIADLDSGAHDAPAAIVDTLARVLVLYVFADVARDVTTNEIVQPEHKHT